MDNQYQQQYESSNPNRGSSMNPVKIIRGRSKSFEYASMICGIAAIVTCTCLYFSLIFGAMAIVFGLLSRGGEKHMGEKAIVGVATGGTGLGLTAIIYIITFTILINAYGGITNLMDTVNEMDDMTIEEVYSDIYEHLYGELD